MVRRVLLLCFAVFAVSAGCAPLLQPHIDWTEERLNSRNFLHELIVTVRDSESGHTVPNYPVAFIDWNCFDNGPRWHCDIASIGSGVLWSSRSNFLASGFTDQLGKYTFTGKTTFVPGAYLGAVTTAFTDPIWADHISCHYSRYPIRRYDVTLYINSAEYLERSNEHLKYFSIYTGSVQSDEKLPLSHKFLGFRPGRDVCPRRRADASTAE